MILRHSRLVTGVVCLVVAIAHAGCGESTTTVGSGGSGAGGSGAGGSGGGSTGGTGGTGGTTTTSTTTSTGPLTCADPVSIPPIVGGMCDLLQQNCLPGETCIPSADGTSTLCRKEGGLKGAGKPCTLNQGLQECQAGLFCVGPPDGVGICTRPCCQTDDQPCGGGDCNSEVNFVGVTIFMCSYSEQCTLFAEDTCKNGQQCQLVYPTQGLAVCTLIAPEMVPPGGACNYINECGAAQVCIGGICRHNCKKSVGGAVGDGGCPDAQVCQDFYMGSAGDIGLCQ